MLNSNPIGAMNAGQRLDALIDEGGIQVCGNAQNCVRVCPKEIPLTTSIGRMAAPPRSTCCASGSIGRAAGPQAAPLTIVRLPDYNHGNRLISVPSNNVRCQYPPRSPPRFQNHDRKQQQREHR